MSIQCPHCKADVTIEESVWRWHERGRSAACPKCSLVMVQSRFVDGHKRTRPKHTSKKERLKARAEEQLSKKALPV